MLLIQLNISLINSNNQTKTRGLVKLSRLEKKYKHVVGPYMAAIKVKPRRYKKVVKESAIIYCHDLDLAGVIDKMNVMYPFIGKNFMTPMKFNQEE
jgi:hypothetical protein